MLLFFTAQLIDQLRCLLRTAFIYFTFCQLKLYVWNLNFLNWHERNVQWKRMSLEMDKMLQGENLLRFNILCFVKGNLAPVFFFFFWFSECNMVQKVYWNWNYWDWSPSAAIKPWFSFNYMDFALNHIKTRQEVNFIPIYETNWNFLIDFFKFIFHFSESALFRRLFARMNANFNYRI